MWFSAVFQAQFGFFFLTRDYTINLSFLRLYSPQHVKFQLVNRYCQQYTVTNSSVPMYQSEQQVNRKFLAKYGGSSRPSPTAEVRHRCRFSHRFYTTCQLPACSRPDHAHQLHLRWGTCTTNKCASQSRFRRSEIVLLHLTPL